MNKVLCRVKFYALEDANSLVEIIGNVDLTQIISQSSKWITVENTYFLNNVIRNTQSIIHKASIHELIVYKKNGRYSFDKHKLGVVCHLLNFHS